MDSLRVATVAAERTLPNIIPCRFEFVQAFWRWATVSVICQISRIRQKRFEAVFHRSTEMEKPVGLFKLPLRIGRVARNSPTDGATPY
jgi:hypothetical protein